MFADLTQKLDGVFSRLRNRGKISEKDIDETAREVRRALLEADVNFRVVKDFVAAVKERALGENVVKSFTPAQQIVKIIHEELTRLLGGKSVPFVLKQPDATVMVVGLQGSGKTTFTAKLGLFLKKQGKKPLLVGLDVHRPAAMEQLEILGKQIDLPVCRGAANSKDVGEIYERARVRARELLCDTLILDTAGRLHVDDEAMRELEALKTLSQPEGCGTQMDPAGRSGLPPSQGSAGQPRTPGPNGSGSPRSPSRALTMSVMLIVKSRMHGSISTRVLVGLLGLFWKAEMSAKMSGKTSTLSSGATQTQVSSSKPPVMSPSPEVCTSNGAE